MKERLEWVAVSLDRWELRRGARSLGALIRFPVSRWGAENGRSDTWAALPRGRRGRNYMKPKARLRDAARDLLWYFGLPHSAPPSPRCESA
jgi:hypothetical protein